MSVRTFFQELGSILNKERQIIIVHKHKCIPSGEYVLVELYCDDLECDCRRVMVNVVPDDDPGKILATISYGWEDTAFYNKYSEEFLPRGESGGSIKGPYLDPLNYQSDFAPAFLELFKEHISGSNCEEVFRKHYKLCRDTVKEAVGRERSRKKAGRNDPCPCGSGKKYKKCCLSEDEKQIRGRDGGFFPGIPEDILTGTGYDEYILLMPAVATFARGFMQFEEEGRTVKKASEDFEKRFAPGGDNGIYDSIYLSWLYLDFRFGKEQKTLCERFLESDIVKELNYPGPVYLKHMSDSYLNFYELREIYDDRIVVADLWTRKEWRVYRIDDIFEKDLHKGDILYVRLIGLPEESYTYSTPYIFPQKAKFVFVDMLKELEEIFSACCEGTDASEEGKYRDLCKAFVPFWAAYMLESARLKPRGFFLACLRDMGEPLSEYAGNEKAVVWIGSGRVPPLTKKEIQSICCNDEDFENEEFIRNFKVFLTYIAATKVKVTPKQKGIPLKHLYAINESFCNPRQLFEIYMNKKYGPRNEWDIQEIFFMDLLSEAGRLLKRKQNDILAPDENYEEFFEMSGFKKKHYLVFSWFFNMNWDEWFPSGNFGKELQDNLFDLLLFVEKIACAKEPMEFNKFSSDMMKCLDLKWHSQSQDFIHNHISWGIKKCFLNPLSTLGLINISSYTEEDGGFEYKKVKEFEATAMGKIFLKELVRMGRAMNRAEISGK